MNTSIREGERQPEHDTLAVLFFNAAGIAALHVLDVSLPQTHDSSDPVIIELCLSQIKSHSTESGVWEQ